MKKRPLILVTNDDGITAPGMRTLISVMNEIGDVVVVAPDSPQSGMGHAVTINETLYCDEIKVDDAKVRAKVEEIAEPYDEPTQVISWYYGDKQRLAEIESLVFEEQIIEWLLTKVTVDEKTKKFKELMQPEAKQAVA